MVLFISVCYFCQIATKSLGQKSLVTLFEPNYFTNSTVVCFGPEALSRNYWDSKSFQNHLGTSNI